MGVGSGRFRRLGVRHLLGDYPRTAARLGCGDGNASIVRFLTGSIEDIVAVEKAFDAFGGSKMNHRPLTFLRPPGSSDWIRIDGFASAAELASEVRALAPR